MRMLTIFLFAALLVLTTACGSDSTESQNPPEKIPGDAEKVTSPELPATRRYRDANVGFSFQYPSSVKLDAEGDELSVSVDAVPVDMLDQMENGIDPETADGDRQALAEGNFGTGENLALEASKSTRKVGDRTAQDYVVLTDNDPCSVVLRRKLVFFKDGYRVAISTHGAITPIIEKYADHFTTDDDNCGGDYRWKNESAQQEFWQKLNQDQEGPASEWWKLSESIHGSVKF